MRSHAFKTRFAPSPTGRLHLGNVRTALFNWLLARRHGGVFLLRLEDTDAMRGHEKYATALAEDLRWLGLGWDEGPGVGGAHGPYAQSERSDIYKDYFARLEQQRLAYPCFCSEHELAVERKVAIASHLPPRYSGKCRTLTPDQIQAKFAAGLPATLRFHVPAARPVEFDDKVRGPQKFNSANIGDFVIRRSDGTPAFFFCNAIDDALMGVTLVVRGEDHLTNTPRQIMLLEALGLPAPEYAHIALVVGADGAPLSKRTGSQSVEELRAAGFLPAALHNYLARLGHTYEDNAFLSLDTLVAGFSVERLHKAPARFDEAQLLHWQREAVKNLPAEALWTWMGEAVHALVPRERRMDFVECIRGNVTKPHDSIEWAQVLFGSETIELTREAKDMLEAAPKGSSFRGFLDGMDSIGWNVSRFGKEFPLDRAPKKSFPLVRAALTGRVKGPEMWRLLGLLGEVRVRARLNAAEPLLGSMFKGHSH